jgi:hypothetical protein
VIDLIDGYAPVAPCLAERFHRDIESNLFPILEKVGHSFGDAVDANGLSFETMNLDSLIEGCSAETGNT